MSSPQKIYWGVNQGLAPGAFIEIIQGDFISWNQLKEELDKRAIVQCPKIILPGSVVRLGSFHGKDNWIIEIIDAQHKVIGSVWIGGDPLNAWVQDGLVRIGKTVSDTEWIVYQILARHDDGSYRLIQSFV